MDVRLAAHLLQHDPAELIARLRQGGQTALPVVNLTFDPTYLNKQLLVLGRFQGKVRTQNVSASVTVPAGKTTSFVIPTNEGKITLTSGSVHLTTNYVSSAITMVFGVDGTVLTPPPYEYVFTRDTDTFHLGEFYYIQRYIEVAVSNFSTQDAIMGATAPAFEVDAEFFWRYYKGIVDTAIRAIEHLVG